MVLVEQSQRPYRFGMTLLCVGALFNWLGVADSYSDPVPAIRYIGVGLIAAGAILICLAMCFWMKSVRPATVNIDSEAGMHVQSLEGPNLSLEKPPDYATVVDVPPCYEDAIKLNPAALLPMQSYNAFIEKSVSLTKEEPARVNITVDSAVALSSSQSADLKKGSDKIDESAQVASSNNTFSRVLRKSIRGIRKQLTSSGPQEGATSGSDCPATSSHSYNVIAVIPSGYNPSSKLSSLHKTSTALNSRTAAGDTAVGSTKECSECPMGDPPPYDETVDNQNNCQSCANQANGASIAENDATSKDVSRIEGEISATNIYHSQSAPADVHSFSSNVTCASAAFEDSQIPEGKESSPDANDVGLISNKVSEIISSAQSEAQRKQSLVYVDASRNR